MKDFDPDFRDVRWRHVKSGGIYNIIHFALREKDLEPLVVYREHKPGEATPTWTRPLSEFLDGRFVQYEAMRQQAVEVRVEGVMPPISEDTIRRSIELSGVTSKRQAAIIGRANLTRDLLWFQRGEKPPTHAQWEAHLAGQTKALTEAREALLRFGFDVTDSAVDILDNMLGDLEQEAKQGFPE